MKTFLESLYAILYLSVKKKFDDEEILQLIRLNWQYLFGFLNFELEGCYIYFYIYIPVEFAVPNLLYPGY